MTDPVTIRRDDVGEIRSKPVLQPPLSDSEKRIAILVDALSLIPVNSVMGGGFAGTPTYYKVSLTVPQVEHIKRVLTAESQLGKVRIGRALES